jgi:hypothetical protein
MLFRVLFRSAAFVAILGCASAVTHFVYRSNAAAHAARQATQAKHGLTGSYYISNWDKDVPPPAGPYAQVWHHPNDFGLPRIFTAPVATRVDAQVAFGQGKGFSAKNSGPPVVWWPAASALPVGWTDKNVWDYFAAVIWKGYIHLPKAGTYYFGTVSNGGSAVYLNQARVALNGNFGGVLVSDAFAYAKENVQDLIQNLRGGNESVISQGDPRFQYIIPVSIDAPRDLPLEVRYNPSGHFTHWASEPFGVDLFWVTPDSPRDAHGKPIASIVPNDALYTEAPGQIETPGVRSANSTVSADFLYFDIKSDHFVTVTVRLADRDGHPVSGKRVSIATVGAQPDEIVQPDKATDEKGEATGKIRANQTYAAPHDTTIFATDVTDLVDVAQVGHLTFQKIIEAGSFFPDSFSPYYDPHAPEVTPLPLQVGRQVTVKMPLVNRNKFVADVNVVFEIHASNIGAADWQEIGRVKNIRLQPGEHKDATIQWTPDQSSTHICFLVAVNATKVGAGLPSSQALSAAFLPAFFQQGAPAPKGSDSNAGTQQHNIGPVAPGCPLSPCADLKEAETTATDLTEWHLHTPSGQEWNDMLAARRSLLANSISRALNDVCENKKAQQQLQNMLSELNAISSSGSKSAADVVREGKTISGILSDLQGLGSQLGCSANPRPTPSPTNCPAGTEPNDKENPALKQVIDGLIEAVKKWQEYTDELDKAKPAPNSPAWNQLQNSVTTLTKLKKALEFWKKIQAAQCIPPEIPGLMQAVLRDQQSHTDPQADCNNLCYSTAVWLNKIDPAEFPITTFFDVCANSCGGLPHVPQ